MVSPEERAFGRLEAHGIGDDQDRSYPMRAAIAAVPLPPFRYWPFFARPFDQGVTGTCVGHGGKNWMLSAPVMQTKRDGPPTPFDLYREACAVDEWTQNDNGDLNFGTSVRALFKVLQARGLVAEYRWASNMQDVIDFVLLHGPVVIGVNWYEGMLRPDASGYINLTGSVVGGHCVLVVGHNRTRGDFTIVNSWGDWGPKHGRALIRSADLQRLLFNEGGEAAAGLEVKLTVGQPLGVPAWGDMAMNVIQAPAHPNNYGGYNRFNTPRALVFHTPEEQPDDVESTIAWFQNPVAQASAHAYADNDGDLYVMVDDHQCAWAVGTYSDYVDANGVFHASNRHWKGNYKGWAPWNPEHISNNCLSLSMEIEGRARDLDMPEEQYQTVLAWAYEKVVRYGIPVDRDHLIGHGDLATDRTDPGAFFPWDRFMADLAALVAGPAAPAPIPGGSGVTFRALDSTESLAALELVAKNFGAGSVDNSVTIVEVTGGLPQDVARYIPAGGHAWLFTTKT